jgi:hypothetical protein
MWHFERVLVGPYKGAFMNPCFVRGNKDLCASMSRHQLPSAEMYSQAFLTQSQQFILDPPSNQLVTHRPTDQYPQHWCQDDIATNADVPTKEWNRIHSLLSSTVPNDCNYRTTTTTGTTNSKTEKLQPPEDATHTTPIAAHITANNVKSPVKLSMGSRAAIPASDIGLIDDEEDWSLLSDCLDKLLNKTAPHTGEGAICQTHFEDKKPTKEKVACRKCDNKAYYAVDALAPGMNEPASPEMVEILFAELSGCK